MGKIDSTNSFHMSFQQLDRYTKFADAKFDHESKPAEQAKGALRWKVLFATRIKVSKSEELRLVAVHCSLLTSCSSFE